ncbi:hypothetical protein C9374_013870 [Naegleria lovaniensis]|uniref:Uncharacterized protein n=1 Tax=Naegleria lovaniensis TaxID=51637 RepID=A0AA88GYC6_NAELO|nr:uncharacterized protein C9374_013870 [Naegleria lovaniensis]KAG2389310.1 hypothetical protein C9374_013870 [Naegleria lovaniensis]
MNENDEARNQRIASELNMKALHRLVYKYNSNYSMNRKQQSNDDDHHQLSTSTEEQNFHHRKEETKDDHPQQETDIHGSLPTITTTSQPSMNIHHSTASSSPEEETTTNHTSIPSSSSTLFHSVHWLCQVLSEQVFTQRVMKVLKSLSIGSVLGFVVLNMLEWCFSYRSNRVHHHSLNTSRRGINIQSSSPFQQLEQLREHSLYKSPQSSLHHSDPMPRSQKGRFYLHELSTSMDDEQPLSSSRDSVVGNLTSPNSEGPLFVPLARIEKFQQLQREHKMAPDTRRQQQVELDQDLQNNALYGQMVQLESYRKSTIFGE